MSNSFTSFSHYIRALSLASVVLLVSGCISYEPAQLVPAVTLSPEQVNLVATAADAAQVDFGIDVAVNESDSLFNVEVLPGIRVRSVSANGPAANAGIEVGDIILSVDGTETNNPDALTLRAQTNQASGSYAFTVQRNTVVFEATVIARALSSNPPPQSLYRIDPLATRAGYRSELVEIDNQGTIAAARVVELYPRSPLPAADIRRDDLILALDGEYLNSAQDLVTRLNRDHELGDTVRFTRFRDGDLAEVEVSLWDPGRRISRIALGPLFRYESSLSPDSTSVSLLDLWLFSLYSFQQQEGERSHSLLGLINFSSDAGELIEESN